MSGKMMIYRRRGWKDKELTVVGEDKEAGTVDLANEADGEAVVTSCPVIADPAEFTAEGKSLPDGFATYAPGQVKSGGSSGPKVDEEAVAEVAAIFQDEGAVPSEEFLDGLNVPTLFAIAEKLEAPGVDSKTKKADLIAAIRLRAEAGDESEE